MHIRSVSFGANARTPVIQGAGIVLAEPGSARTEDGLEWVPIFGCCRVPSKDIEVERSEVLRGVFLTVIFAPTQAPITFPLVAPNLVFVDDLVDQGPDLVGSFQCDFMLRPGTGPFYLHAAFRHHVSNVVRLMSTGTL